MVPAWFRPALHRPAVFAVVAAALAAGTFTLAAQTVAPSAPARSTPPVAPRTGQATGAPATTAPATTVTAIESPATPIPQEADSAGVDWFSFIVYGDTRGRRDGKDLQYEHSLVVDEMLLAIERAKKTAWPIRFVLQSGDAVVNGRDAAQWNRSFVELINRITRDGGIPYFLAPGNHDVTSSADSASPDRKQALNNYLAAVAKLIPPTAPRGASPATRPTQLATGMSS